MTPKTTARITSKVIARIRGCSANALPRGHVSISASVIRAIDAS